MPSVVRYSAVLIERVGKPKDATYCFRQLARDEWDGLDTRSGFGTLCPSTCTESVVMVYVRAFVNNALRLNARDASAGCPCLLLILTIRNIGA